MDIKNLMESEDACRDYLLQAQRDKRTHGFQCTKCGFTGSWRSKRGCLICRRCQRPHRITAATAFRRSHICLRTWFKAIWLVSSRTTGVSARRLQQELRLGSYQTALSILRQLHALMSRANLQYGKLVGSVEVGHTWIGGALRARTGTHKGGHPAILICVEANEFDLDHMCMEYVPNFSSDELVRFVVGTVEPKARLQTNGWVGYSPLGKRGFFLRPLLEGSPNPSAYIPNVNHHAASVESFLCSTYRKRMEREYLQGYLDEYVFRVNGQRSPEGRFRRLLEQAV